MGRDNNIYSFSHLTFHEYFAAREAKEKAYFTPLTEHLTEKRWREVILLTVGMLPTADRLLIEMKQCIDGLLSRDKIPQKILEWLHQKADSVNAPYKPAAIRAFYFIHASIFNYTYNPNLAIAFDLAHTLDLDLDLEGVRAFDHHPDYTREPELAYVLDPNLSYLLNRTVAVNLADLSRTRNSVRDPKLKLELEALSAPLSNDESIYNEQSQWWQEHGQTWIAQLRSVMIEYRNIGHDWQLSEAQTQRLQQYYEANQLLVACLNSDCYVSRAVREEIEDTLLLPLAEIERRRTS